MQAVVKERIRQLSLALAAIEETQCMWSIPDVVLRANLRDALADDFVVPYEALLARNAASASRVGNKHIRFQVRHTEFSQIIVECTPDLGRCRFCAAGTPVSFTS